MATMKKLKDGWASVFGTSKSNNTSQQSSNTTTTNNNNNNKAKVPSSHGHNRDDSSSFYPVPLDAPSTATSTSGHSSDNHHTNTPATATVTAAISTPSSSSSSSGVSLSSFVQSGGHTTSGGNGNDDDMMTLDDDTATSVIARHASSTSGIARDPHDAMIGLATPDDRKHPDVPLSTPTPIMMVDDLPRRASSLKAEAERLERHRIFNEILQDRHRFAHFLRFVDRNSQPNPQQPDESPMFGPSSLSELLFICEINQLLERDRSMDSLELVTTVSRMVQTYIKGSHGEIPVAGIRASTRLHLLSVLSTLESVAAALPQHSYGHTISGGSGGGGGSTPTDHRRRPSLPGVLTPARLLPSSSSSSSVSHAHGNQRGIGGGEGIPLQQRKELMMLLKWARDEVEDQLTLKSLALYLEHVDSNSELELAASYEFADVLRDNSCYRSFLLFLMEDRRYRPLIFFWEFSAVRAEERVICGTPSPQTSFNHSNASSSTPVAGANAGVPTSTRAGAVTPIATNSTSIHTGGLVSPSMSLSIVAPLPVTPVSSLVLHNHDTSSASATGISINVTTPSSTTHHLHHTNDGTASIDINMLAPMAPDMILSPTLSPIPISSSSPLMNVSSSTSSSMSSSNITSDDEKQLTLQRLADLCDRIADIYYRFVTCAPSLPGASPLDLLQTSSHDIISGQPSMAMMAAAAPNSPLTVSSSSSSSSGGRTGRVPLPPVDDDDYDMPHNTEEYWRARIGRYMAFLIPLSKKTEKVLRLQLWPQFCRSRYYKDLASRRARHLARAKDHRDRFTTQGSSSTATKLLRGKSTDAQTSRALTAMAMAKSSTSSLPLSATLAALASSLSSSTATAPLTPSNASANATSGSTLADMFAPPTAPAPTPAPAPATTTPTTVTTSSTISNVSSTSISSTTTTAPMVYLPHPPATTPPPLTISAQTDFVTVHVPSSSPTSVSSTVSSSTTTNAPPLLPSPNPSSSSSSVASSITDTNSSTTAPTKDGSVKRVVAFSSDTSFTAHPPPQPLPLSSSNVPLTRTASLSVDRAPVPPPLATKRTTSGSGIITRPGNDSQNSMVAMLGGVASELMHAFTSASSSPSSSPNPSTAGGAYRARSSQTPDRHTSRQRSASEERAATAAAARDHHSVTNTPNRPSTSHGTPSKAKPPVSRVGAAAAGGFGGGSGSSNTSGSQTTTTNNHGVGQSATVRVRSSKDQKERDARPSLQSLSFTAPLPPSSTTNVTRERNKSMDAKSTTTPSTTLSRSNSGNVASSTSSSASSSSSSSTSSGRKSQGPMERERRHSTTMVSWLKQQKVTRDMIVIECQTISQATDRKRRHDNPLGRPMKNQRMFEYVCVLRATNNVARSSSVPIVSSSSSSSNSNNRGVDSVNKGAATGGGAANKPKSLYKIEMVHRYPQHDHTEAALPQHIGELCFPDNADVDGLCTCRHPVAKKHRDGQLKDHWGFPVHTNANGNNGSNHGHHNTGGDFDNDTRTAYLDAMEKERAKRQSSGGDRDRLFNFILTTVDGTRLYGACIQVFEDDDHTVDETHNTKSGKSKAVPPSGAPLSSSTGTGGHGHGNNDDSTDDDNDDMNDSSNDYQGELDDEKEERDRLVAEQKERQRLAALAALNQMTGIEPSSPTPTGTNNGAPSVTTSSVLLTPPPVRGRGNTDSKLQRPSSATLSSLPSSSASSDSVPPSSSSSHKSRSRDPHRLRSMDPDSLRYRRAGTSSLRNDGSPLPHVGRRTASPLAKRRRPNGYAVVILSALPLVQLLRDALRSLPLQRDLNIESVISTSQFQRLVQMTKPASIPVDIFGVDNSPLQVPAHDFSLGILFRCLHPRRVLLVVESLILERKILLLSSQNSILTLVGESLRSLLYPFKWNYLYIPILPLSMFVYLECPTPFLMGLHSCYKDRALDLLDKDVVIVDLDNDEVVSRTQDKSHQQRLPVSCRTHLLSVMQHLYFPTLTTLDIPSIRTSLCAAFYPHITPPAITGSSLPSPHSHLTTVLHHVHHQQPASSSTATVVDATSTSTSNCSSCQSSLTSPSGGTSMQSLPFVFSTLSSSLPNSGRVPSSPFVSPRASSSQVSMPQLDISISSPLSTSTSMASSSSLPTDGLPLPTIDEKTGLMLSSPLPTPSAPSAVSSPRIYDRAWFRNEYGDDASVGGVRVIPDPSIELRLEFLKMWTSIMAGYRHFAVYLPDNQRVKPRIERTTGVAPITTPTPTPLSSSQSFGGMTNNDSLSSSSSISLPSSLSMTSIGSSSGTNSGGPSQSSSMDDIAGVRSRSQSHDDTTHGGVAAPTATSSAPSATAAAGAVTDDRSEPTMVFDSPSFVLAKAATGAIRTSSFVNALVRTSYFPIFLYERTIPSGLSSVSRDAFDRYEATFTGARRGPARGEANPNNVGHGNGTGTAGGTAGGGGGHASLWQYHRHHTHRGMSDPSINRLGHLKGWDVHTTLTFHHLCRIPLTNFTDAPTIASVPVAAPVAQPPSSSTSS